MCEIVLEVVIDIFIEKKFKKRGEYSNSYNYY